jgi:teichuronic acid biosynthesis glycosyltransferase TuaG
MISYRHENPLVSIVMPTYNCGKFIKESINSVLGQTYIHWELIIVDDNSQDTTELIIKELQETCNRIIYLKLEINSGAAVARNKAIELAGGQYIAFLDSDDLWYPSKLEEQITFMEINHYNFTYTKYMQISEAGIPTGRVISSIPKVAYKKMLYQNYIGNSTAIYNCKELGKIYVPIIRKRNDYALWLKILKTGTEAFRYDEVLMKYRVTANSLSSNKRGLLKYQWELYHDIEELSSIRCLAYIGYNIFLKVFKLK